MNLFYRLGLTFAFAGERYGVGPLIGLAFLAIAAGGLLSMAAIAAFGE